MIENIKVVLLGDSGVGKTCIALRFIKKTFDPNSLSTQVNGMQSKTLSIPGYSAPFRFQIWDTAGQEKYRSMATFYYKDALAGIVVYDVTKAVTFEGAKSWIKEVREKGLKDVLIVLVGNKIDLIEEEEVDQTVAREYAESVGAHFMLISAKDNINISDIFEYIGKNLRKVEQVTKGDNPESKGKEKVINEPKPPAGVKLDKDSDKGKAKDKCC